MTAAPAHAGRSGRARLEALYDGKRYSFIDNDPFVVVMKLNVPGRSVDNVDVVGVNPSGPPEDE